MELSTLICRSSRHKDLTNLMTTGRSRLTSGHLALPARARVTVYLQFLPLHLTGVVCHAWHVAIRAAM